MPVHKVDSTDAFYIVDLDGADRSVGVVRLAPKVLVDGAELLARSTTYALALFGRRAGGASAGINAKPDGRDDAVTAFCEAVAPLVGAGELVLSPGTGVSADELAPLGGEPFDDALVARGAIAAAAAFAPNGGSGASGAVAGPAAADWSDRLGPWWADTGGTWNEVAGLDAQVDVLFLTGKAGLLDDDAAGGVRAPVLVGVTPVPVTAKAYATLTRAGIVFVPDLVAGAAAWLAAVDGSGEPVEEIAAKAAELRAANAAEPWRAAIEQAEAFLLTWQPALPFGRPLA